MYEIKGVSHEKERMRHESCLGQWEKKVMSHEEERTMRQYLREHMLMSKIEGSWYE